MNQTRVHRRQSIPLVVLDAASVTDYEGIHAHILMMADQLSAGVMDQFPSRFR